jgi:ribosomal protein S18 acetylase RimI-like enzyme
VNAPLVIRRASVADAATLARITELTFTETFGHLYPPEDLAEYLRGNCTPESCRKLLNDPKLGVWFIGAEGAGIDGAEPVGYVTAGPCKLPVENREPNAGEVRQLYVLAFHQNQRLGAQLLDTALGWLTEQHFSPIYIGVWSQNDGAQRFYGRYGFRKVGEYGFPVGQTVDHEFILKR